MVIIGPMVETAVGEGATEALVEEQKQECDLHAFVCEPVGITAAIALEKSVTFELAQVVAELIETVSVGRKLKRGENGLVNLLGGSGDFSVKNVALARTAITTPEATAE